MSFIRQLSLCLFVSVFLSAPSFAADQITAGVNYHNFDYKEDLRAPLKSTEKAGFFALFVKGLIEIPSLAESYVLLSGEISGNVNSSFDGTTQTGVPVTDTNNLSFAEFDGSFFWNIAPDFFLQAGLGYHSWNRFLSGGSGYREIYTWYYMPIGFLYRQKVSSNFSMGVDLTYRMMFQGQIQVIFSETVANGSDTNLTLGNRPGYKLQVPMEYDFAASSLGMTVTPWYETSEIGESEFKYNSTPTTSGPLGYIQEPSSKTEQWGVLLGAKYRF